MQISLQEFLAVVGSTAVIVSSAGFAAATAYKSVLEKGLQSGFDHKLEKFRADLRKEEERLKAELRKQDTEISELRSGVLQNAAARHLALENRQRQAIEAIWSAAVSLFEISHLLPVIAAMARVYNDIEAFDRSEKFKIKKVVELINDVMENDKRMGLTKQAELDQIYVDERTWSTFLAIKLICSAASIQARMLEAGISPKPIEENTSIKGVMISALPTHKSTLENASIYECYSYHSLLHTQLFSLLQRGLEGGKFDQRQMEVRAGIFAASISANAELAEISKGVNG